MIEKDTIVENEDKTIKLIHGDAYKTIDYFLENNITVNHIITDPPYNISKENNFGTMKNRLGLDFGEWDKSFDDLSWIGKYEKILDKNGSMIIFCSYLNISFIARELENNNMVVKDVLEWKKTNPQPRNVSRRYVQDTEFAIWAVKKNAKWVFNKPTLVPYLRSSFYYAVVQGKQRIHPTQKNLSLMQEIIEIHTNANDIILDPFMGSGTTGIAASNHGRKFIGIEKEFEYFEKTIQRFEQNKKGD